MNLFFKDTKPFGQLFALVVIFIIFFILSMGVAVVGGLFGVEATGMLMQELSQIIAFGGTAFAFALLFFDRPVAQLGLGGSGDGRLPMSLLGAFLILLCVIPLSDWLAQINDSWHFPTALEGLEVMFREIAELSRVTMERFLMCDGMGRLLVNLFVLALTPAICEELLFRGVLQQVLVKCVKNVHVAVWLTAAIFSIMHGDVFAFLPRFMLGALLGYLFYYGGSLWVNVMAHFTNNAIVVLTYLLINKGVVAYEYAETFNSPWYLALAGTSLAILLFWFFYKKTLSVK